jgi:hypothetical protein
MIRMRHLTLALATAGLASAAACSQVLQGADEPAAQVIFVNQSLSQANVYVVTDGGTSRRLGTVFAGRTDTLDVPSSVLASGGTLRITVRLLASSAAPQTGPLSISSGDVLRVTLPSGAQVLTVLPGS